MVNCRYKAQVQIQFSSPCLLRSCRFCAPSWDFEPHTYPSSHSESRTVHFPNPHTFLDGRLHTEIQYSALKTFIFSVSDSYVVRTLTFSIATNYCSPPCTLLVVAVNVFPNPMPTPQLASGDSERFPHPHAFPTPC